MKTKDWAAIMRVHPVFAMLNDDQRAQLLNPDVSTEITYEKDETIIRQGELGRSVFLLSDGSAAVTMRRGGENDVELYSVGYGELFGEMALIEERPRAASVKANETSVVLEIDGIAFGVGLVADLHSWDLGWRRHNLEVHARRVVEQHCFVRRLIECGD